MHCVRGACERRHLSKEVCDDSDQAEQDHYQSLFCHQPCNLLPDAIRIFLLETRQRLVCVWNKEAQVQFTVPTMKLIPLFPA